MEQKIEWTIATWANRATGTYVPADTAINGVYVDRYGNTGTTPNFSSECRRCPVKYEEAEGATYIAFSSDSGLIPILKLSEVEG